MSIKNDVEVRKGPGYDPVKGHGYFNKADDASEFTAKTNEKAREPFTHRQGQAVSVDITDPGYFPALDKAWEGMRPDLAEDKGSKLWTMPWMQRESMAAKACESGIDGLDGFDEIAEQASKFGVESLNMYQRDAFEMGRDDFGAAMEFAGACGRLDPEGGKTESDPHGELRNTGRFVTLESPDGEVSGYLMEMAPLNETHRFLDLECPEGTAQILQLKEGDYSVHGVWEESPMLTAGLESARKYFAGHDGLIPLRECGTGTEAAKQVSSLDRMHAMMGGNETDVVDGPAFTGSDEPGVI